MRGEIMICTNRNQSRACPILAEGKNVLCKFNPYSLATHPLPLMLTIKFILNRSLPPPSPFLKVLIEI